MTFIKNELMKVWTQWKKYFVLLITIGIVVPIDQISKIYIHTHTNTNEIFKELIPNFFNIIYVRNKGAAFGFLANTPPSFRDAFFLIVPIFVLFFLFFIFRSLSEKKHQLQITSLSFIFSGAIGNYIDRLRFGYVIDFLDFHYYNKFTWPAFNVADSFIVIGVSIIFLDTLFNRESPFRSSPSKEESLPKT